jgi:hypothetical protein
MRTPPKCLPKKEYDSEKKRVVVKDDNCAAPSTKKRKHNVASSTATAMLLSVFTFLTIGFPLPGVPNLFSSSIQLGSLSGPLALPSGNAISDYSPFGSDRAGGRILMGLEEKDEDAQTGVSGIHSRSTRPGKWAPSVTSVLDDDATQVTHLSKQRVARTSHTPSQDTLQV